jgi:hypothetical protein
MKKSEVVARNLEVEQRAERNIRAFLLTLTSERDMFFRECGIVWYPGANHIASTYNDVIRGSGQLSALSPRTRWETNDRDFHNYQIGIRSKSLPKIRVSKCDAIAALPDDANLVANILRILNGPKTKGFFLNILYPDTSMDVTIDAVMCALMGITDAELGWAGMYEILSNMIRRLAHEYGFKLPSQFQAYVWCAFRGKAD